MEQRQQADLLILVGRGLQFATNHPYAATGIFGAAIGSAITYTVMTAQSPRQSVNRIFTPKIYELVLTSEDLRRLSDSVKYEIRMETTETVVIVTAEKPEPLKQLPAIDADPA